MKENIRSTTSGDELSKNSNMFFFCTCKMVEVTKKTWERNGVQVIVFNDKK